MNHYPTASPDIKENSGNRLNLNALPSLLTIGEVARFLHCSKRTIGRLTQAGKLDYIRPFHAILITRSSLLKFIGSPLNRLTKAGKADAIAHRIKHESADSAASAIEEGGER